jgi:hypothetical protein
MMRSGSFLIGVCAFALLAGCGGAPPATKPAEAPAKPAEPAVPADITAVAQSALGSEAEVLLFGDLAQTGRRQVLAINRMPKAPTGAVPGVLLTRAIILEEKDGNWREILRCDEHLKNANGYLGATPITPVTGWRLQFEQDPKKGLQLYFMPLQAGTAHPAAIGVRWDPAVKRYRSLDRNYETFLGEIPALEVPNSRLK